MSVWYGGEDIALHIKIMLICCLLCHSKVNFSMSLRLSSLISLHVGCKKSQCIQIMR